MENPAGPIEPQRSPWLTVITVVFNDPRGLASTAQSLDDQPWIAPIEHIVVDGSNDSGAAAFTRSLARAGRKCIIEPDSGIYDAMNKGLAVATGDHVLFLNAGDRLSEAFDERAVRAAAQALPNAVVLGYCVERFGDDRYLNPGLGREARTVRSPHHQATVYPRSFYSNNRYEIEFGITADGRYTKFAVERGGAVFAFTPIAEFALGGASSSYESLAALISRMRESGMHRWLHLISKFLIWRLLPRNMFYRLLASYKYTRVVDEAQLRGLSSPPRVLDTSGSSSVT